jgi:hypothetical protein
MTTFAKPCVIVFATLLICLTCQLDNDSRVVLIPATNPKWLQFRLIELTAFITWNASPSKIILWSPNSLLKRVAWCYYQFKVNPFSQTYCSNYVPLKVPHHNTNTNSHVAKIHWCIPNNFVCTCWSCPHYLSPKNSLIVIVLSGHT